jgi:hypothetical protein
MPSASGGSGNEAVPPAVRDARITTDVALAWRASNPVPASMASSASMALNVPRTAADSRCA